MSFNKILITVGTTEFDSLIQKFNDSDVQLILKRFDCKELRLQTGTGKTKAVFDGIKVENFSLKTGLQEDIQWADLIISHAGFDIQSLSNVKSLILKYNSQCWNLFRGIELGKTFACCN